MNLFSGVNGFSHALYSDIVINRLFKEPKGEAPFKEQSFGFLRVSVCVFFISAQQFAFFTLFNREKVKDYINEHCLKKRNVAACVQCYEYKWGRTTNLNSAVLSHICWIPVSSALFHEEFPIL